MKRFLAAFTGLLLAASAARAADSEFSKPAATAKRSVAARRSAAGSAFVVHNGVGSGFSSSGASGAPLVFHNGRELSTGGRVSSGAAGTVRPLRPMTGALSVNSTAVGGAVVSRGYGASTPGESAPGSFKPGSIKMDGKGRALAGPGVTQGQADTPPGGGSSGSSGPDFMSNILNGLANMFGSMASMLGGGG